MSKNENNTDNQEIDFTQIRQKMNSLIDDLNARLFGMLQFIVKNIIVIALLFIIGAVLGYFMDESKVKYQSNIIVTPNFGSVDYMYNKLELLGSKILERDTVFLKGIGIKNPKKLLDIEVEPISDIYSFVGKNESNLNLVKLMADDNGMSKILADPTTSKNYKFHKIKFMTLNKTDREKTLEPILAYLNNSDYFIKIQKEELKTLSLKIESISQTIGQIDGFLNQLSNTQAGGNTKNGSLVYYNENAQINDVIKSKELLVYQQGAYRVDLVTQDSIIKECNAALNIKNTSSINGKMKLVLPFLFIFLFICIKKFKSFYKKQSLKARQEKVQI